MKRFRNITIFFVLSFSHSLILPFCFSQPQRVEIEAKMYADKYNIVPVGEEGLMLFHESDERSKSGGKKWVFTKYDIEFKEIWTAEFPILNNLNLLHFKYIENNRSLYLVMGKEKTWSQTSAIYDNGGVFQIVTINISNGEIKSVAGELPHGFITRFDVMGSNDAFLSGFTFPSTFVSNMMTCLFIFPIPCVPYLIAAPLVYVSQPLVLDVSLKSGSTKSLMDKMKGVSFVVGSGVSEADKTISILVRSEFSRKESATFKYVFAEGGKKISQTMLKGAPDKVINDGRFSAIGANEEIIAGTFANREIRGFAFGMGRITKRYQAVSSGIFFGKMENLPTGQAGQKQKFFNYFEFGKLKSFYEYFSGGRSNIMNNNRQAAKISDLLLIHDLIQRNDEYIMIAEAYYKSYHTEYRMTMGTNGQMYMQPYQVFDGFRYTHAIICGFSKDGELLWDQTFEIGNIRSYELKERVKALPGVNSITLLYSDGANVYSKVIEGRTVLEDKKSSRIQTGSQSDRIIQDDDGEVAYWYGNNFITYGYQKIKDTEKEFGKRKRTVFYFNKLSY